MALPQLTSSDAEALAREKINAAITEADKVGGIGAALAALQITLAPYTDLVGGTPNRPGDSRTLFTRQMTGAPKLRPAIDKGSVENGGELGQVLRISGADTDPALGYIDVAPRRAYYMRPGRAYLVRHAFARFQDPTDPEQNAVELRFQNLSASFAQVSNVRFGSAYAPAVTDGPLFVDTFIGKAGAPGTPSYVVPLSSAYGVPFFRVFGNGHLTDLGEVWLYDVSDALAGGADIASIIARVARLEVTQSANIILASSWVDLAGRTGRVSGAGAEVPDSDTGTHTDPITGAVNTPNPGRYQWSVSPAGWRWVSKTTARQAADFIGVAARETSFFHNNVDGMSLNAAAENVYHAFFVHGQSLALGQNPNEVEPLLASAPRYPGLALTMDAPSSPGAGPRLGAQEPRTIVNLVEARSTNAGETIVSGMVNHAIQRYDRETPPKLTLGIADGKIVSAILDKEAWGYGSTPPAITVDNTGSGGSGAVLTSIVTSIEDGGRLIGVTITNSGSGYTSAPKATVAANTSGTPLAVPKIFGFASGKVGAKYIQLRQGEARWRWIDAGLRAAKGEVALLDGRVICYGWAWKQGEADLIGGINRQPEDIENWMVQYARQRAADTMAITGQSVTPILIISPAATCHPDYDQWSQPYPRALELLRKRSGIRITGGTYQHPHSDASHLTNAGYNHSGQEVSRVYTHEINNDGWNDIHPTRSWRESGTTLKVEFAVPPPESPLRPRLGLMIDLSDAIVKLDGIQGYGGFALRSRASGRALTITGITVDADGRTLSIAHDTLTATASASSVSVASNALTVSPRIGMETGTRVRLSTTGTLPGGLFADRDYFVIRTLANQIKLALTLPDSLAIVPVPVFISSQGEGSFTITADGRASGDSALQLVYATRRNPGNTNDDGPVLGARGCLRNSRAHVNIYDGYLSHDWATPFDIVVSATAPFNRGLRFADLSTLSAATWIAFDPSTGEALNVSLETMKSYVESVAMPKTYSSEPPGLSAELTSKVILPPDDLRMNLQVQCETHDLAVNWSGRAASFDRDAVVYAGVIPDWIAKGKEAVSVIARPSSLRTIAGATTPAKVWVSQDRLVPGYISGSLFADTVLSNYPDQGLNKAYRGTLRDRINRLNDLGIWEKLTVVIFPVHIIDNLAVNLAKPSVPMVLKGAVDTTTVGKMTVAAYRNWGATGPAAYIDTGLAPSSGLGLSSAGHLMGVQIDGTTLETATGFAGNSPTYYIKPNASATVAGFRSGGTGQDSVPVAAGGWVMGNRIAADTYDLYGEGAAVAKPGTLGTPGERNLFICALNTSNGAASPSTLRARGFVHGFGLQGSGAPAEVRDAFKAIFAAADLASGA